MAEPLRLETRICKCGCGLQWKALPGSPNEYATKSCKWNASMAKNSVKNPKAIEAEIKRFIKLGISDGKIALTMGVSEELVSVIRSQPRVRHPWERINS